MGPRFAFVLIAAGAIELLAGLAFSPVAAVGVGASGGAPTGASGSGES